MPPGPNGATKLIVLIGTVKGAFFYHTDIDRADWELTGPHLAGWEVYSLCGDPRNDRILAGTCSYTYGATLRETCDFGATWKEVEQGPAYPAESGSRLLEEHPLLRPHLYDESMHLRKHVLIVHNDDNLATIGDRNVELKPGDRLLVLQAVSGG
jgi:hypothetical protein